MPGEALTSVNLGNTGNGILGGQNAGSLSDIKGIKRYTSLESYGFPSLKVDKDVKVPSTAKQLPKLSASLLSHTGSNIKTSIPKVAAANMPSIPHMPRVSGGFRRSR